ncbi:MAG: peptidoglycan DD-metalloendopeptidase family protein [Clostridia bacterium]|nr:peptidoglycan DD-metalloendopeptidase family protein [Clostridia bacterium]
MKISKKLAIVLAALVLCLVSVVSVLAVCFGNSKNQTTEEGSAPSPSFKEEIESSSPITEVPSPSVSKEEEPEESITQEQTMVPVWYYGNTRLGVADARHSHEEVLEKALSLLGTPYQPSEELTLKEEYCTDPSLSLELAAKRIAQLVKAEYSEGWALYINNVLTAIAESEETLRQALNAFLEDYSEQEGGKSVLRGLTYQNGYIAKNNEFLSGNEIVALLTLCADAESEKLAGVDYGKIDSFLNNHEQPVVEPIVITEEVIEIEEIIKFSTVDRADKSMYVGEKKLYQAGKNGKRLVSYTVVYENGVEVSRTRTGSSMLEEAVDEIYLVGALPEGSATGTLMWPTTEGRISSYYGYRYLFNEYKLHGGLDIAISTGTPLYAADGGTVEIAGDLGNTYGTYVVIDHGNGMKTLYAHMSKLSVKKGDLVNKGDLIGKSGATGRVTGPHLHFEVRIDGSRVNPSKYLPSEKER